MATAPKRPRWNLSGLMGRLNAALPAKNAGRGAFSGEMHTPAPVVLSVREENHDELDASALVPRTLRVAAAFSWRTLVVVGLVTAFLWAAAGLTLVIMPVAIALTLAVLLEPLVSWMRRKLHFPSSLAAAVGLLVFFFAVAGALSQAAAELIQQVPQLAVQAAEGFGTLIQMISTNDYLKNGPLKIDTTVLNQAADQMRSEVVNWLNTNKETLATGALNITSSVGTLATSGLTMLFCLFFFLKEGRSIWLWCVRLLPAPARVPVHESAIRGWATFGSYVRTQIQVAAIDAVGIALGAFFLGVPLAIPIGVITFFAAFVPILGALTSGVIAVMVAALNGGLSKAIIMLIIMIAAFINATVMYLHGYDPMPELATAQDRPGGPPGTLEKQIAATYAGKPDTRPYTSVLEADGDEVVASVDAHAEVRVEREAPAPSGAVAESAGEKSGEPPTPHVEA